MLIFGHIRCNIDRVAHRNYHRRSVAKIVAVFDAYRHDIDRFLAGQALVGTQCNPKDALTQRQKTMFGTMRTFGQNTKRHAIGQHIDSALHDFIVFGQIREPIADAHDGHNLQKMKQFGLCRFSENIGTRHKHFRGSIQRQHRQRVL